MKRVAIACFSLILFLGLGEVATAQQIQHRAAMKSAPLTKTRLLSPSVKSQSVATAGLTCASPITALDLKGLSQLVTSPLATIDTERIGYFQDTTNDNWWIYTPVFSAGPDSMNYLRAGSKEYEVISDSIGPIAVNDNGNTVTIDDTLYRRVMALRVSTPTDLKSTKLQGADITIFPISMSSNDVIQFWVVPIADVQFVDQNGTPTNIYPIPDLFGSQIAKGTISSSDLTMGEINTVHVNFGAKSLGTRKQFGICVFVDEPDFINDTVGFLLDANAQAVSGPVDIDTDGTMGVVSGVDGPISMRTYRGTLDAGNQVLPGHSGPSLIGIVGNFFIGFGQLDPESGDPTGLGFFGNLVLNTVFSGTPASSVDPQSTETYSLLQNSPNPVVSTTGIEYNLEKSGPVSLTVYNVMGEQVGTVINGMQDAGNHLAKFDAKNLANGMYYYKLQAGDFVATRTMVVNK